MRKAFCSILAFIAFAGCSNHEKNIGRFLILDSANIIHTNEYCSNLLSEESTTGSQLKGKIFVDTLDFSEKYNTSLEEKRPVQYCKKCVSAHQYGMIKNISERNAKYKRQCCEMTVKGQVHLVDLSNIKSYGWEAYAKDYPDATLHMCDAEYQDYDVPLSDVEAMMEIGLKVVIYQRLQ